MGKGIEKLNEIRSFCAEAARQAFETPLYELGIRAYSGAVGIASLFNDKARKLKRGHKGVIRRLRESTDSYSRWIWVHAASLGEFEQGRPLIERIRKHHPEYKILLTFFSPSGYEVRKNYREADIVCYLPFDTLSNARRVVEAVRPEKAIFVKYEIWRNYLTQLRKHGVPTYLVSAIFRPEQAFFNRRGSWYRSWLHNFSHIFVQDDRSRRLLAEVGIGNVSVAGDTRFDRVTDIRDTNRPIPELEKFFRDADLRFMAGSSWPQDEEVYGKWLLRHPEVKAVIAPHEFDGSRLAALKKRFEGKSVLLSELRSEENAGEGKQILIIDCFGLLSSAYAYADMAYVGGAFGAGLHNVNEAAVYSIPVIFGPKFGKFLEARDLVTLGGGISVDSRESFERTADRLLYDPADREHRGKWAGEYIAEKTGASDRVYAAIFGE